MEQHLLSDSVVLIIGVMAAGLVLMYAGFAAYLRWRYGPAERVKKKQRQKKNAQVKRRR